MTPTRPGRPEPVIEFVPDRRYTVLAGIGFLVAVGLALFAGTAPGRLLAGIAALMLTAYVVCDLVYSPRLVVSAAGVIIRSPFTRADLAWPVIESVRADSRSRFGLRSTVLEVDAGAVLAVFSTRSLGRAAEDAAAVIDGFRPR